jgi:hypothetical protein
VSIQTGEFGHQTELADLRDTLGAFLDLEFCVDIIGVGLDGVERPVGFGGNFLTWILI